ncbi:MAG: DUF1501 domain-containing protein [Thermohalobaculum sp.]
MAQTPGGNTEGNRFLFINLRGGLDGLSFVQPYGDPNFARLRGELAGAPVNTNGGLLDLGGFFGLHPQLTGLHSLYKAGEALFIHAVASADRSRSHFVAQAFLQSGSSSTSSTGWMNTLTGLVPTAPNPAFKNVINLCNRNPQITAGPQRVGQWSSGGYMIQPQPFWNNVQKLALSDGRYFSSFIDGMTSSSALKSATGLPNSSLVQDAWLAASALSIQGGPTVAYVEQSEFDTHNDQNARLAPVFADLDAAVMMLKSTLGPLWQRTVVVLASEFGRTVAVNGTSGTDHGTAFAACVLGGAISGGKVLGSWPGLSSGQLYQERDLAPTSDIQAVLSTILMQHVGVAPTEIPRLFPGASTTLYPGIF